MFKKNVWVGILAASLLFASSSNAGTVPVMVSLVLDGTGSMSDSDFRTASKEAVKVIEWFELRAAINPGATADLLSVSWFGGDDEFQSTDFYNCSHSWRMNELKQHLRYKSHPKFGSTSVYTAALASLASSYDVGGASYYHIVILMTDGGDTGSSEEFKVLFKALYPNDQSFLCIAGVGASAELSPYSGYADKLIRIDQVEDFAGEILLLLTWLEVNLGI